MRLLRTKANVPGRMGRGWPPAFLSAAFPLDDAPVLERVLGFPSFCFGAAVPSCGCGTRLLPTANLPSLRIVAGVTGWICFACDGTMGEVGEVDRGGVGDVDGRETADRGASDGGCAGGGIGMSSGEGVSPGTSPRPGALRWGLGWIDEGAVGGNSGVDVAERVARILALLLLDEPPAAFLSAGEGRFRAGLLVTLDSSPLDDVFGLFEPVVPLRTRPVTVDGPGAGNVLVALWYESSMGLDSGGSSLKSNSPGEGSG